MEQPIQLSLFKLPPVIHEVESNFFHGKMYRGDDGTTKTYKSNPRNLTTIEMIRKGIRTQTTRKNVKWEIGDTVRFTDLGKTKDKQGHLSNTAFQSVSVTITKISALNEREFKLFEGWDHTVWDNRKNQLQGYKMYRFKLITN